MRDRLKREQVAGRGGGLGQTGLEDCHGNLDLLKTTEGILNR
jgi:hypothetical protein